MLLLTADYCTFWFEKIRGVYIGLCCLNHDNCYDSDRFRVACDLDLWACVFSQFVSANMAVFGSAVATVMTVVVLAVGWAFKIRTGQK